VLCVDVFGILDGIRFLFDCFLMMEDTNYVGQRDCKCERSN